MSIQEQKILLRKEMRRRLRHQSADALLGEDLRISTMLIDYIMEHAFRHVLAFHPWKQEIDLRPFLQLCLDEGLTLSLPRVQTDGETLEVRTISSLNDLSEGYCSILEPNPDCCSISDLRTIDLVIVPGLAFNRFGHRLGQGAGHYDRLLPLLPKKCRRLGVAHRIQLLDQPLPTEAHDYLLDGIVTPAGLINCPGTEVLHEQ